jgi:hypothetical protein
MGSRFKYRFYFLIVLSLAGILGHAQNYHAVQGSSYAGSLSLGSNPAGIVNAPYAWDVNLFSAQLKYTTNALTIYKYSLLSSAANSEYQFDRGSYKRTFDFNFNSNILNARFALDARQAIGFGMNLRGYGNIKTSEYNYVDTIKRISHLLKLNDPNTVYEMDHLHSSWIEIFATYSRTIWDHETDRLNAGITVKAMRGISGAFAGFKNVQANIVPTGNPPTYTVGAGSAAYGYSSNYDTWKKEKTTNDNVMDFLTHSEGGLSLDMGAEYIIKTQSVTSFEDDESYLDYDWKFGVALLDLGQNNYKNGIHSRTFGNIRNNITDAALQKKFDSIRSVKGFNDSLSSIVQNTGRPGTMFTVLNPARAVFNADRYLSGNFYLNAELSLNLSPLAGKESRYVQELNVLTVTPRWETRRWGGYLPITYNTKGKLWVGGAFKAGPLLFGIHNWGNVFSSKKMANGGGYLALVIRASDVIRNGKYRMLDCPPAN